MFNLFDILQAQAALQPQGAGANGVGQQFGLSPEQSRNALEALLPAFTIGLQRNAANDPMGFAQLFGLAGAKPAQAAQPDLAMMQLFGSPMVSQAVIRQAAMASGVATPVLRQMMPVLAGMVVAGIVHLALNPPAAEPAARSGRAPDPAASAFGFSPSPLWLDMMASLMAPVAAAIPVAHAPAAASRPSPPAPAKASARAPAVAATPSDASGFDLVQTMFQSGIDAHEHNVRAMQGIFDSFWSAKPPSNDAAPAKTAAPKRR